MTDKLPPPFLKFFINFWPPFIGAGIKVIKISPDFRQVEVSLKLRWYNKNYLGTHFGGSLFSMADAFDVLMLLHNLGRDYIVWDKAGEIQFKLPGKGTIHVTFNLTEDEIIHIKKMADQQQKYIFERSVDLINLQGEVVATVVKTLYVRRKHKK